MPAATSGMPAISVVMATYNGSRHLAEQLASIERQDPRPDELFILDDCSTDDTWPLLQAWAASRPWVRIARNERNLGINGTFYRLLRESRGALVLVSDQDDVWEAGKIAAMQRGIGAHALAFSDARVIDENGKLLHESELGMHKVTPVTGRRPLSFVLNNCISGHNAAITRALADALPSPPTSMLYDQWLALNAALGDGIGFVAQPLCRHRLHTGNANNNALLRRDDARVRDRRSEALKRIGFLQETIANLAALRGRDAAFDAFAARAGAAATGLEQRYFSLPLCLLLLAHRAELFPGQSASRGIRKAVKLSLGGRSWRIA